MIYYNIRVVEADDTEEAIDNIQSELFEEGDTLCDAILTFEELFFELNKRKHD